MLRLASLAFVVLVGAAPHAQAQPGTSGTTPAGAAQTRPTSDEKRCTASRRRVERQQEVIAEADARTERDKAARQSCKTKRACESLDRALKAAQTRSQRHAKQLAQFETEASKACAAAQASRSG